MLLRNSCGGNGMQGCSHHPSGLFPCSLGVCDCMGDVSWSMEVLGYMMVQP